MSKRTFVSGLSGNSGTYNVRENELLQVKGKQINNKSQASGSDKPAKIIRCTVVFLDDSRHTFAVNVSILCTHLKVTFVAYSIYYLFTF
jgi:hypothetical protein